MCPGVWRNSNWTSPRVPLAVRDRRSQLQRPPGVHDPGAGGLGPTRWPERKSAWKCVSMTSSMVMPGPPGVGEVLADVALRVDDHGTAGGLVADQVGRVRQTVQVVLVEQHSGILLRSRRVPGRAFRVPDSVGQPAPSASPPLYLPQSRDDELRNRHGRAPFGTAASWITTSLHSRPCSTMAMTPAN